VNGRPTVVRRLVVVTLVVGLLTGFAGLLLVRTLERGSQLRTASVSQVAAAERTAGIVDGRVDAVIQLVSLLATREELAEATADAEVELQVALRITDELERLALFDTEGEVVAAAASDLSLEPDEVRPRTDVAELLEGPDARVVGAGVDRILEVTVPVESPPGTPVGLLVGETQLARIADEVARPTSAGARASLVDRDGVTIADRDRSRLEDGFRRPLDELPPDDPTALLDGPDGLQLVTAVPMRTLDASVVVEESEAAILDRAARNLREPAAVLLIVVIATVAGVIATGQRLLRPLGPLAVGVRRLGAGEADVRVDERGTGEVADLARGFNTMATALEGRRRELEEAERTARMSEERLRLVVEGVQDYAIVLLDVLGDVRTWNAGARQVTGVDESAILGRRLTSLADPDDRPADPLPEATRSGHGESEGWYVRPDGSRFYGQLTITALRRDDGAPYGYAAILQDVTERRAAREALEEALHREQEAANELRQANQLKDEFLAVAAHEIRTPMSAILGATQLLKSGAGALGPDEAEEVRELIWRHASDMRDIVERLLDFTQLQAGRVHLEPRPLSLREELEATVDALGRLLAEHHVVVDAPADEVEVDQGLLRHVVGNLLSNAAKFSPPGTAVRVEADLRPDVLTLTVTDEGVGIAADDHDRIFELFRQAEYDAPSARGTGVGLAIVRRYVELAGGSVRVDSERGAGARFTVELPLHGVRTSGGANG
jgi:PAS domain S-box-containing protein